MNKIQFILETTKDPMWETNNVRTISMDFIEGSEESLSQVRQGGIDNSHLSELQDSIILRGQEVPITVEAIEPEEGDEDSHTSYRLIDGGHRYLAISKLRAKNKHCSRWTVIRARIVKFNNDYERVQYQHAANDHTLPAKNNSNDDAALWLNELVHTGFEGAPPNLEVLFGSSGRNKTDPDGYEKDLKEALSFQFPDMGNRRRSGIVKNFIKKIPGKYKTWDGERAKTELLRYIANNDLVSLPAKCGLVLVREPNHVMFSASANSLALTLAQSDRDKEIVAIVWTNKTSGRKTVDIDQDRIDTIRRINELNSHNRLRRGKKLINRIFIAPQKLDDNVETGFYEVSITGNNKFSLSIPAKGWDTTQAAAESELAAK